MLMVPLSELWNKCLILSLVFVKEILVKYCEKILLVPLSELWNKCLYRKYWYNIVWQNFNGALVQAMKQVFV